MTLGEKIFLLRKQHGLTLEDVGNAVGVGKSTVRKWENGTIANMRRDKIQSLASVLHTTPSYLMGWEDEKKTAAALPVDALWWCEAHQEELAVIQAWCDSLSSANQ